MKISHCSLALAFIAVTACFRVAAAPAADAAAPVASGWTQDMESAFKTAAKEKKPVFINFTGSDWCYWCKIADKNIFQTKEWSAFSKKVVCLKVDFPRDGAPDAATMNKRRGFARGFNVRGYPTFVLADAGRAELARFVAGRKDAATFIGEVDAALKRMAK
jgi:protein disulfide-isomerase